MYGERMIMNLDELNISIKSNSDDASKSLDRLTQSLETLSSALGGLQGSSLVSFADGVEKLSLAMNNMKSSNISASTFNSLTKSLGKLATLDSAKMYSLGLSLNQMVAPLQSLGGLGNTASAIRDLSKGISTLGNERVQKATTYLPLLTKELTRMMTELSKAPRVSQNLIDMTNALGNLTRNGQKVGSALNGVKNAMNTSHTPIARASVGTRNMSSGFDQLSSAIGKFYVKFWLAIRLIKKFVQVTESAMDYIEAFNFFDVAITSATDDWSKYGYESADAYALAFEDRMNELNEKMSGFKIDSLTGDISSSFNQNLGINITDLVTFESEIVSITSSLGLCSKASADASEALAMLSADMSSLHNIDLSTVFKNFQSGLIGQSRSLYKYGIDITNATLSQYALANGVTKSVQAMSQAEKMQLRVLAIFQQINGQVAQSENAWGDLANTINGRIELPSVA